MTLPLASVVVAGLPEAVQVADVVRNTLPLADCCVCRTLPAGS